MAFSENKITVADLTGKGVTGMADTPNLTTAQMQQKLDEIAKEVIPPKFNALCDDLDATDFSSIITSKSTDKMIFQRLNEYDQIEYSVDNVNWYLIASGKEVLDPTLEADNAKNAYKLGGQLPAYYQKTTDSALNTTDKTTTGAINEVKNALDNLSSDAVDINYDNTASGLTATNVQSAVDEVNNRLNDITTGTIINGLLSGDVTVSSGDYNFITFPEAGKYLVQFSFFQSPAGSPLLIYNELDVLFDVSSGSNMFILDVPVNHLTYKFRPNSWTGILYRTLIQARKL